MIYYCIKMSFLMKHFFISFLGVALTCCSTTKVPSSTSPAIDQFLPIKEDTAIIVPASLRSEPNPCEIFKYFSQLLLDPDKKVPFHAYEDRYNAWIVNEFLHGPVSILWCYQGGYGSPRIIKYLTQKPIKPTMVVGYSDITALHLFFSQNWGWKTLHGPMASELLKSPEEKDPKNFKLLADILSGKISKWSIEHLKPLNAAARRSSSISGRLTGGNATLLERSLGTCWEIQGKDKIIFIEDVGCKGYQIDRSLDHLKEAGVFKNAKAILLGDFEAQSGDEFVQFALERFANELSIPVFQTNQFGHGFHNVPIMYNAQGHIHNGRLDIDSKN